jgi:hypothetical protein
MVKRLQAQVMVVKFVERLVEWEDPAAPCFMALLSLSFLLS